MLALRSVMALAIVVPCIGAVAVACDAYSEGAPDDAGVDGRTDADGPDADAVDADAGSSSLDGQADVEAGRALLVDDRFETMSVACPSWTLEATTAEIVPGGRSGNACRLCGTTNIGSRSVERRVDTAVPGTYTTTLYAKREANTDAGKYSLVTVWDADGGENTTSYVAVTLSDNFTLGQSVANEAKPASFVKIRIFVPPMVDGCILVDDVQLRRE